MLLQAVYIFIFLISQYFIVSCGSHNINDASVAKSSVIESFLTLDRNCGHDEIYISQLARKLFQANQDNLSQTEAHFIMHAHKKLESLRMDVGCLNVLSAFEKDPVLRQTMHKMIALEKREAQKGNYTFVHGQPWVLHFFEELYTFLWQVVTQRKVDNFLFLRFKRLYFDNIQDFTTKYAKHIKNYNHYLNHGTNGYYASSYGGRTNQNYLMFLNYALFNNQFGSSSARYIAKGDSENGIGKALSIETIFSYFGLRGCYDEFASELESLKQDHEKLTQKKHQQYGHSMLISIAPTMVNKLVYVSWTGVKHKFSLADGNKTEDVKQILDILRSNPYQLSTTSYISVDHNEFSLILSLNGALKPDNGFWVHSIPPVSQKTWDAYCKKRDALFKRIERTIQQKCMIPLTRVYWQSVIQIMY